MRASMQRLFGEFGHYSPWGRGKHTVASPSSAALFLRLLGGRAVLPQELTLSGNHLASLPEEVFKPLEGLNTLVPRLPHELGVCRLRRTALVGGAAPAGGQILEQFQAFVQGILGVLAEANAPPSCMTFLS